MKRKDELLTWVRRKIERGFSPDSIKKTLIKTGGDPSVVDEYLKSLNSSQVIPENGTIKEKLLTEGNTLQKMIKDESKHEKWIKTGIEGLDALLKKGIPRGSIILVIGGPGSGKTIFCLQTLYHAVQNGEKALYMSFEEEPEKLREHMRDFGWDPEKYEKEGLLRIKKYDPIKISKIVEALLEKAEGELKIDIPPLFLEDDFKPDRVVVDSLSAIAAAFVAGESYYRIYVEQFFNQFRETGITPFLITESQEFPKRLTKSGVEEFLADGAIILHTFRKGSHKERGIEIYKLRGAKFEEKIVAMQIVTDKGIVVYPTQEVFVSTE